MRYFFLLFMLLLSITANCQQYYLFIGTYTGTGSKGIYVYSFNTETGKAKLLSNTEGVINPSYLAISHDGSVLYGCNETASKDGGEISAFNFDRNNGTLTFLNKQFTGGDHPAYISIHKKGRWVVAGNYSGGSIAALAVNKDGSLNEYSQLVKHTGKGIDKLRQDKPHVHATVFSPNGKHLLVPDLGIDKVLIYPFNAFAIKPLQENAVSFITASPGSGPRHFVFHPNNKFAYLIEEMAGAISAYKHKKGKLYFQQRIFTHPDSSKEQFGSADIHVSPDGKFLYASNRGSENNIAIFSIGNKGYLTSAGYKSSLGIKPRNFIIDPAGRYLIVANQQTNNIVIFKRDIKTGLLEYTGEQIIIPEPVCLKIVPK